MPDVTERAVTAVTTMSVTSLLPRPMRSLTSDERKPALLGLRTPDARTFKGLAGSLLRADFPKQGFRGLLGLLFSKKPQYFLLCRALKYPCLPISRDEHDYRLLRLRKEEEQGDQESEAD